jgi:hypothetical protein
MLDLRIRTLIYNYCYVFHNTSYIKGTKVNVAEFSLVKTILFPMNSLFKNNMYSFRN